MIGSNFFTLESIFMDVGSNHADLFLHYFVLFHPIVIAPLDTSQLFLYFFFSLFC